MANAFRPLRVGEVAKQTGLSVRTLHHYDDIGLLKPSARSESRYRLYDEGDLLRLLQIKALRQLGLSLQEIRELLGGSTKSPREILEHRIDALDQQIKAQKRIRAQLEQIVAALRSGRIPPGSKLIEAIEGMTMFEKHFTSEQLDELHRRRETIGEEHIKEVEAEWPRLIEAVRNEMAAGTPPTDPKVQKLAKRWLELVREFSGGNTAVENSVAKMYKSEPSVSQQMGLDPAIFDYISKAGTTR